MAWLVLVVLLLVCWWIFEVWVAGVDARSSEHSQLATGEEIEQLQASGHTDEAVSKAERALASGSTLHPFSANSIVNAFINAGRYQDALAIEGRTARRPLLDVNLAEAEYNLGRWELAEARLTPYSADEVMQVDPVAATGIVIQRAWIAASRGRASEALALMASVQVHNLPAEYQSEAHFTQGLALLAAGQHVEAQVAIEHGQRLAIRPSAQRNALFLLARVAAAAGRQEDAVALCEQAAAAPYQRQGGDGLLFWGDLLAKLGRHEAARAAWELACVRDPESESAAMARTRRDDPGARSGQGDQKAVGDAGVEDGELEGGQDRDGRE